MSIMGGMATGNLQDVSLFPAGVTDDDWPTPIYTVSVDEKPGVQAIGLTAPDLPPIPEKNLLLREIMSTFVMELCPFMPPLICTRGRSLPMLNQGIAEEIDYSNIPLKPLSQCPHEAEH